MSTSTGMIGTVLSSRYRLESKLGSGGMSTVYLALDTTLDRRLLVEIVSSYIDQHHDAKQSRMESNS